MGAAFALIAAFSWGASDFLGGFQSRRLSSVVVTLWSQLIGGLAILLVAILVGRSTSLEGLALGGCAGVCTGLALACFYRGLSQGAMAIVAPISACGAVVPVVASFAIGGVPSALQFGAIVLCLVGAVGVSIPNRDGSAHANPYTAVAYGAAAATGFGFFYVFVNLATENGATPLWAIVAARTGAFLTVALIAAFSRPTLRVPRGLRLTLLATGLLDTTANISFAYAQTLGDLPVASVLASLYPLTTLVLAYLVTREKMTPLRITAAAVTVAGAAILTAASA